jgi:hypothetical protein
MPAAAPYGEPDTQFGFKGGRSAEVFVEAERAKHRPGRRRNTESVSEPLTVAIGLVKEKSN